MRMHSLFSELGNLWDDLWAMLQSPAKAKSLFGIPLYSNALYLMLSNLTNSLFGFCFWIIAARLYTTNNVGLASAIISSATLIEMLSVLGLGYGLIRFLKTSVNTFKLINSVFTLTGLLSLAAAGIFVIGLGIWSPGLSIIRQDHIYLAIFILFVPILVLDDFTDTVMMARRQGRFVLIHNVIFNILKLALLALFAVFSDSLGIFGSWGTATFIALLISIFLLVPQALPGYRPFFVVDRKAVTNILHFSFLNYLGDLFWTMPGLILPIIVINQLGAESNAYFFIAWAMSAILTIIPGAIATSLLAEGSNDAVQLKSHVRRSLKMVAVLLVPSAVILWFLSDKFLLFYGSQYAKNATTLLHWLVIAAFPVALNTVYFGVKRIQKKMKPVIFSAAFMAIIVVLMSYLLLPRMGINGIGIAWLTGQSMTAIIIMVADMRYWLSG